MHFQKPVIAPKPQLPPRPQSISPTPPPSNNKSQNVRQRPASLSAAQNATLTSDRPSNLPIGAAKDSPQTTGSAESPEKLSLKARLKLFEKEIEQQGQAPSKKAEKKFSFLNADEVAKLREEEAKRLASRSQVEIERLASTAQIEADEAADKAIDLHEQLDGVLVRKASQNEAVQLVHTAKAERRMREKAEREGEAMEELGGGEDMSPAAKRALDAERRAAWRKARLKSLENVSSVKVC